MCCPVNNVHWSGRYSGSSGQARRGVLAVAVATSRNAGADEEGALLWGSPLDGVFILFTGADSDDFFNRRNKDLSVSDFSGTGGLG